MHASVWNIYLWGCHRIKICYLTQLLLYVFSSPLDFKLLIFFHSNGNFYLMIHDTKKLAVFISGADREANTPLA